MSQLAKHCKKLLASLLRQEENSDEEFADIERRLRSCLATEVKGIARKLKVKIAGANKKSELIARLIAVSRLGTIRDTSHPSDDEGHAGAARDGDRAGKCTLPGLSYLTPGVKQKLASLPAFDEVTDG